MLFFAIFQIWSSYFNLAVEFLTQPALQLEKFSEVKRGKIIEKYGDMRVLMGYQILSVWSKLGKKIDFWGVNIVKPSAEIIFFLGEHKVFFIPAMVGPFLEVTLVPESDLRKATLNIFFDMMQIEEKIRGNFKQVGVKKNFTRWSFARITPSFYLFLFMMIDFILT